MRRRMITRPTPTLRRNTSPMTTETMKTTGNKSTAIPTHPPTRFNRRTDSTLWYETEILCAQK